MTYKYRYALQLSKDLKILMNILRNKKGLVARTALFTKINGEWIMLNRPTDVKILSRNHQYYFRKRLPSNYKSVHSELFYIDEFIEIKTKKT